MAEAVANERTVQSDEGNQPTLAIPIRISEQVVGVIRLQKDKRLASWTDSEIELMETLTDRLSQALDSARLYQDTQRRAAQEQLLSEISSNIRQTLDIDTVIRNAAKEFGEAFNAQEVIIRMNPKDTK
jgi:GAF domain-containing protein